MISTKFKDTNLHIGDTLKVRYNIVEGGKTRVQSYEGILLALRGRSENRMMVVRRIGPLGVGVERTWPVNSLNLIEVQVMRHAKKVRRSKLYYMRNLKGRAASRV